ncbi:MAG: hypothetical protein ACFCD0_27375 [Gemmataceae bacterium]
MSSSVNSIDATTAKRLDNIRGTAPQRSPSVRVLSAYSQNTTCPLATLGFAAKVDFDKLLVGTKFRTPFGQSPFAIQRGNAFEELLRQNNYALTLDLLREPLNLQSGQGRVVNLRQGLPGGSKKMSDRADATKNLVREIIAGKPTAPHLIDGAVLRGCIGGLEAFFEADALAARTANGMLRVAEVKSFPKVDDRLDSDKLGAALDQVAIYVLLARQVVDALGGDPEGMVSDQALIITPRNVGLTPTLSEKSVVPNVARIKRVMSAIPSAKDIATATPETITFSTVADKTAEEEKRIDALAQIADTVGTAYTPTCLSTCGNARFCRDRAIHAGSPCAVGTPVARALPEIVSLGRAESLSRGTTPTPAEAPTAQLLHQAGRLIDETLPA